MKQQKSTLLKTLSLAALLAINSYAYQAGDGASDNGIEDNTAVGKNASATAYSTTAIGVSSVASAEGATGVGRNAKALAQYSTAIGAESTASSFSTAMGAFSRAMAINSVAIGVLSTTVRSNSVAIGTGAVARESGVVSFGRGIENGDISNSYARLINVADPINAHDAVNLNYLTNYYTKAQYVDAQDAATLQQSKSYTDQQIAETKKEAANGTALAIALATPLDYSNGSNAMAIGTGFYKGEKAISIMGGKRLNNGISYTAGFASAGSGEHAFKAGVGFSW